MSYLKEFISAVENEIGNDDRIYKLYDANPREYFFLPRPAKWLSYYKEYQIVIFVTGFLARYIWLFGGAILFFTYQCLRQIAAFYSDDDRTDEIYKYAEFGLAFSARAQDVINLNSIGRQPQAWIALPWLKLKPSNSQTHFYNLYALLNFSDFFKALWYSFESIFLLCFSKETSSFLLQGYTAFYWFLTRIALSKFKKGSFLTSEHFDRWALLIDFVVLDLKENPENKSTLSVVQHGLLESLTNAGSTFGTQSFKVRHRLKTVSSVYVYDTESAKVFTESILVPGLRPEVHFFKPQISLQQLSQKSGSVTVLFVGHSICEDVQIYLFQGLSKMTDVVVYYKPHPTCAPHQQVRNQKWILIENVSIYPAVDLLISYPSTLVTEYANHSIPAVIHPINLSVAEAAPILSQIQVQIAKISL